MIEWHNVQTEKPPTGKLLHINWIGNYGNDWVSLGFYAESNTKEKDFDENCLDIVTYLTSDNTFYKYNSKRDISLPVNKVISWAKAK